jgi:hypothetical protein
VKIPWSVDNRRASRWSIHRMLSHGAVMKYEYAYTTIDRLSKGRENKKKKIEVEIGNDGGTG